MVVTLNRKIFRRELTVASSTDDVFMNAIAARETTKDVQSKQNLKKARERWD
jgi:hypothetical protein